MRCPNCGNEAQDDAVFCDQCGTRLRQPDAVAAGSASAGAPGPSAPAAPTAAAPAAAPSAQAIVCPNCGASNTPGEMFCSECGTRLSAPRPEPSAVVERQMAERPVASADVVATDRCPECGAQLAPGDEFCYACGADLRGRIGTGAPVAESPEVVAPVVTDEAAGDEGQPVGEPPLEVAPPIEEAPQAPASAVAEASTGAEAVPGHAPEYVSPEAATAPGRLECPACGAEVSAGDAFCDFCGAALTGLAVASAENTVVSAATAQPEVAPLQARPSAPEVPPEVVPVAPVVPAAGAPASAPRPRLVVPESGVELPLASGSETLVGREDAYSSVFPDIDLTPHGGEQGGVSRRHFKITLSNGQYRIEDLNSTNATMVNRQRLQPGVPVTLADGDEIRAGRVRLIFRMAS